MKPGDIYYADLDGQWWRVEILSKPRNGNVRVRWLAGPLVGREARLEVKGLRKTR